MRSDIIEVLAAKFNPDKLFVQYLRVFVIDKN